MTENLYPRHPYNQKRYNVRLAKRDKSRGLLTSTAIARLPAGAITGGGGGGEPPVGNVVRFGALTLASKGAHALPSGATSIVDAGGTNITIVSGTLRPATDGVTAGTITFNDGITATVSVEANSYSVATVDELIQIGNLTSLTAGTHRILLRAGVVFNPTAARKDIQRGAANPVLGTGVVDITGHSGEARPVVRHIGISQTNGGLVFNPFRFLNIDFVSSFDGLDASPIRVAVLGRDRVDGVQVVGCTFSHDVAMPPELRHQAFKFVYITAGGHGWRITDNIVEDCAYFGHQVFGAYIARNVVKGASYDYVLGTAPGAVFHDNVFYDMRIPYEVRSVTSVTPGATTRFNVPGHGFDTATPDYTLFIRAADGGFASLVQNNAHRNANVTIVDANTIDWAVDSTGLSMGTTLDIELSAWHSDYFQTINGKAIEATDAINGHPLYPRFHAIAYNNTFLVGPGVEERWLSRGQGFFWENDNNVKFPALLVNNLVTAAPHHGMSLTNLLNATILHNVVLSGASDQSNTAIRLNQLDGTIVTGIAEPSKTVVHNNISHTLALPAGASLVNNLAVTPAALATYFPNPTLQTAQNYLTHRADYASLGAANGAGIIQSPTFDIALGQLPNIMGVTTLALAHPNVTPTVHSVASTGTIKAILSNNPATSYTAAQIDAATVGGEITHVWTAATTGGSQALTSATPADGTYVMHAINKAADGSLSNVSTSAQLAVAAPATNVTILQRGYAVTDAAPSATATFPSVTVSPTATKLVIMIAHRGLGDDVHCKVNGTDATLIGEIASAGGTISQTVAYQINNTFGASTVSVEFRGLSGSGPGLLCAIWSTSGASQFAFFGNAPAATGFTSTVNLSVNNGDALMSSIFSTQDFGAITWPNTTAWLGSTKTAGANRWGATSDALIVANNASFNVSPSWANTANNVTHGVIRARL